MNNKRITVLTILVLVFVSFSFVGEPFFNLQNPAYAIKDEFKDKPDPNASNGDKTKKQDRDKEKARKLEIEKQKRDQEKARKIRLEREKRDKERARRLQLEKRKGTRLDDKEFLRASIRDQIRQEIKGELYEKLRQEIRQETLEQITENVLIPRVVSSGVGNQYTILSYYTTVSP